MSDKPRDQLLEVDRVLREIHPVVGMVPDHVQVTIEKVCGFEKFNTRPYHNYETWSDGWRITASEQSGIRDFRHNGKGLRALMVEREDLDDALADYAEAVQLSRDSTPEPCEKCGTTALHDGPYPGCPE